jgi:nickel/cobalt exporter
MLSVIFGTIVFAIVQSFIPSHWLPIIAVAKSEKWSKSDVLITACASAVAHSLGTVILGTILGIIGQTLANKYEGFIHDIAPVILIAFGLIYFSLYSIRPDRSDNYKSVTTKKNKKKVAHFFCCYDVCITMS